MDCHISGMYGLSYLGNDVANEMMPAVTMDLLFMFYLGQFLPHAACKMAHLMMM